MKSATRVVWFPVLPEHLEGGDDASPLRSSLSGERVLQGQSEGRPRNLAGLATTLAFAAIAMSLSACAGAPEGEGRRATLVGSSDPDLRMPLPQEPRLGPSFAQAAPEGIADDASEDDLSDLYGDDEFSDIYGDAAAEEDINDPLETLNRFTFAFNEMLDVVIIRPIAVTYRDWVPPPIKDSIRAFLRNLATPVILMNDLLQGEWERAETTFARFLINTSLSLGVADIAAEAGLPFHDEDFGQTLASYGVGEGFYLVLPILGPSNARDATGRLVDWLADPLTYPWEDRYGIPRAALDGIDFYSRNIETFEEIRKDSVDPYARVRSLYRQIRESDVRNAEGFFQDGQTAPLPEDPLAGEN